MKPFANRQRHIFRKPTEGHWVPVRHTRVDQPVGIDLEWDVRGARVQQNWPSRMSFRRMYVTTFPCPDGYTRKAPKRAMDIYKTQKFEAWEKHYPETNELILPRGLVCTLWTLSITEKRILWKIASLLNKGNICFCDRFNFLFTTRDAQGHNWVHLWLAVVFFSHENFRRSIKLGRISRSCDCRWFCAAFLLGSICFSCTVAFCANCCKAFFFSVSSTDCLTRAVPLLKHNSNKIFE